MPVTLGGSTSISAWTSKEVAPQTWWTIAKIQINQVCLSHVDQELATEALKLHCAVFGSSLT